MKRETAQTIFHLPGLALAPFGSGAVAAHAASPVVMVGTLKAERCGELGPPVIRIPGLQDGSRASRQTLAQLQKEHVLQEVPLAAIGVPALAAGRHLNDFIQSL